MLPRNLTKKQILVWLFWAIAIFVFVSPPEHMPDAPVSGSPVLAGVITHQRRDGPLFVWRYRLRVIIGRRGTCAAADISSRCLGRAVG